MPQITIRQMMMAVAAIAFVFAICFASALVAMAALYACVLAVILLSPPRPSKVSCWFFPIAAVASAGLFTLQALLPVFHKAGYLFLGLLLLLPCVPILGLAWLASREGRAKRIAAAALVTALVALPISMLWNQWPFKLAFYISSPALNRLADRVEAGEAVQWPVQAGIFRISNAVPYGTSGAHLLLVDTKRYDYSGFARKAGAEKGPRRDKIEPGFFWRDRWTYIDED